MQGQCLADVPVYAAVRTGGEADKLRLTLADTGRANDQRGARAVLALLKYQAVVQDTVAFADPLFRQDDKRAPGPAVVKTHGRSGRVGSIDLKFGWFAGLKFKARHVAVSDREILIVEVLRIEAGAVTPVFDAVTVAVVDRCRDQHVVVGGPACKIKGHCYACRIGDAFDKREGD